MLIPTRAYNFLEIGVQAKYETRYKLNFYLAIFFSLDITNYFHFTHSFVKIAAPPSVQFLDSDDTITVKEGMSSVLKFKIDGDKRRPCYVTRNDERSSSNDRVYIKNTTVVFEHIQKTDAGKYDIYVSGIEGSLKSFVLKVECKWSCLSVFILVPRPSSPLSRRD